MVVEQCLLVKAEGVQVFPRQLVFIKLIPPGQFGDTSLFLWITQANFDNFSKKKHPS